MCKYVALYRGVNVGGKNILKMSELKAAFLAAGFGNVSTYINSGNVIFEAGGADSAKKEEALRQTCEQIVEKRFGFHVNAALFSRAAYISVINDAPAWWNADAASKHNAIFVIPPATSADIIREVGEARAEYEKIAFSGQAIFWSAPLSTFSRTHWSKITERRHAYEHITIRNANTTLKLAELIADCQ